MLRFRRQKVNDQMLHRLLGGMPLTLGTGHARGKPTRLETCPSLVTIKLVPAGIIMRNEHEQHNTIDFEASLHQYHIDASNAPPEMTQDCEAIRQKCIRCERETTVACPSCDAARYCSEACLANDAAFHEQVCGQMEKMSSDTRPSPSHFRLVYFPPEATAPSFIWAKVEFYRASGQIIFRFDNHSISTWTKAQGYDTKSWVAALGAQLSIFDHPLGHGLSLLGAQRAHDDATPRDINWAVQSLGKPGHITPMFGTVFGFAYKTDMNGSFVSMSDTGLRDLTHVVDALLQPPCHPACPAPARALYPICAALRFADLSSPWQAALNGPAMELTAMPLKRGYCLAVPFSLGLRWMVHPTPMPQGMQATTTWNPEDPLARLFGSIAFLCHDVSTEGVESVRTSFQRLYFWHGFSVTHVYGGVVHPRHVEGLLAYLKLSGRIKGGASEDGFRGWWEDWKDGLVSSGQDVGCVQGPYIQEDETKAREVAFPYIEGCLESLKGMREGGGRGVEGVFGDLTFEDVRLAICA
ncbi:hypothetical protein ACHAQA_007982 [Verticillium albo-atrum]